MRIKWLCKQLQLWPPLFLFFCIPNQGKECNIPNKVQEQLHILYLVSGFIRYFVASSVLFGSYLEECMSNLRKKGMWLVNKIYMQIPSCRRKFVNITQVDLNCSKTRRQNKQIWTWLFLYSECSLRSPECLMLSLFVSLASRLLNCDLCFAEGR